MNTFLLLFLSLTSILAVYWALFGQWRYNAMMRPAEPSAEKSLERSPAGPEHR
ncbi:hypothetical protein HYU14_07320 [Candidatus Woesearchaeota archaeon]|nr:hypothetical protein [Candidatus Woesearchaeota archaeon]